MFCANKIISLQPVMYEWGFMKNMRILYIQKQKMIHGFSERELMCPIRKPSGVIILHQSRKAKSRSPPGGTKICMIVWT